MNRNEYNIIFKNDAHKEFFRETYLKCGYQDPYHAALAYCLGISEDTRRNINQIYDFKTGCVKPECLHEGSQPSGSQRVVRMVFNLHNNRTPSVFEY